MGRTKGQIEDFNFGGLSDDDLYSLLSHSEKSLRTWFRDMRAVEFQNCEPEAGSSADQTFEEDVSDFFDSIQGYKLGVSDVITERIEAAEEAVKLIEMEIKEKIAEKWIPSGPSKREQIEQLIAQKGAASKDVEIWKTFQTDFEKYYCPQRSEKEIARAPKNLVNDFKALFPPRSLKEEKILEDLVSDFWDTIRYSHSKGEVLEEAEEAKFWEALAAQYRYPLPFCRPEENALEGAKIGGTSSIDFKGLLAPYLLESDRENENGGLVDRRRALLETYLELKSELHRVPFRKELEEAHLLSQRNRKGPRKELEEAHLPSRVNPNRLRSVSMAASRLGLRLGDGRIHAQLKKNFRKCDTENPENLTKAEHLEILGQTFSQLRIKSPEAKRLRENFLDAPFERLLKIVGNRKLFGSIEREIFESAELDVVEHFSNCIPPLEIKVARMINGSREAYDLFVALKSFSKLWSRTHLWAFDFSWVHPGGMPDYQQAADSFFLANLRRIGPKTEIGQEKKVEREAGAWLKRIVETPLGSDLILRCWPPFSLMEGLPGTPNSQKAARRLLDLFRKVQAPEPQEGNPGSMKCRDLAEIDSDFHLLLDFLNPYDLILKGEEYGFFFPPE